MIFFVVLIRSESLIHPIIENIRVRVLAHIFHESQSSKIKRSESSKNTNLKRSVKQASPRLLRYFIRYLEFEKTKLDYSTFGFKGTAN